MWRKYLCSHLLCYIRVTGKKNLMCKWVQLNKNIRIERKQYFSDFGVITWKKQKIPEERLKMDAFNSIELTLKTPNQRVNDIQLKCREDWTIKNLKEHLQDVYPSKPVRRCFIFLTVFDFFWSLYLYCQLTISEL